MHIVIFHLFWGPEKNGGSAQTMSMSGNPQDRWPLAGHKESLEDVGVILTPLPKGFVKEAVYIIHADCSLPVPGTIPEKGWHGEVSCWKPGESLPALASDFESPPHLQNQQWEVFLFCGVSCVFF